MARASAGSTGTRNADGSSGKKARGGWRMPLVFAMLVGSIVAVGVACGSIDDTPPRPTGVGGSGGGGEGGATTGGGPCVEGTTRECHVTLGEHEGVLSCFDGVEHCTEGAWGPCGDGTISSRLAPPKPESAPVRAGGEPEIVVLNHTATGCINNPCDPSCQVFDEDPEAGIKPDGTAPTFNWQTGDLSSFPGGLVNKGLKEPCSQALDCQFNTHCSSPTSGTCSHSKCAPGDPLYADCDACVTKICAADASCCLVPYGGSCAHDPCIAGVGLKSNCSTCVSTVCSKPGLGYCCQNSGTWDAACQAAYATACPKVCAAPTWSQSCVDKVYSVCGASCQTDPPCSHDKCYAGEALNPTCDPCVASICQQTGYCCTSKWDNICVDKVKTVCGVSCPTRGDCVPWLPKETDPKCPGVDLSLGVPCDGVLPVCNHGNTVAPGGIKIVHFPANSDQYPKCSPDLTHPQMVTCTTPANATIQPGECINVTTCGLSTGNREVMINPPGATHVNECFCENNWTLYSGQSGNTCKPPSCSSVTSRTIRKVNMFVQFDRSGSMTTNDRWGKTTTALKSFFADPTSAGLGVALRFWEHFKPVAGCDDTACNADACAVPLVTLGTLTTSPAPTDAQEQKLIDAINSVTPAADTPMYPALAGALKWATTNQLANPTQQYVVVFVTDGIPNSCNTDQTQIAQLAGDAYTNSGVLTYAIGIQDANVALMNSIAQKGGTSSAFFVSEQQDVEQQFLDAMLQIKGDVVACEFDLPTNGLFDPANAKVTYTPSTGAAVVFPKVLSASSCGSGWYYDNNVSPTKIFLCPSTCQTIVNDTGARIDVDLGCPGSYYPTTYTHVYEATCPAGTKVQWGYLAYGTVTPGDANVVFSARTATTQAGLGSTSFTSLATAKAAAPDTQICSIAGPSPCPIDLYQKLGVPGARQEFFELGIAMNPTTDKASGPTVTSWDLSYSCPASE
jgi:hypothetical protein